MQTSSSPQLLDFNAAFDAVLPPKLCGKICALHGPKKRCPPKLKHRDLVKGFTFHALQANGTFAQSVKICTGNTISDAALSQRRTALGMETFQQLLAVALVLKANPRQHPQAFYQGLRLLALDGSKFSVSNAPQISGVMFKAAARRFKAAFAKVGVCVLVELALRNPVAAAIGIEEESETVLAHQLLDKIPADSLTLGDRHYGVRPVIERFFELGRDFLFRVRSNLNRKLIEYYPDGSALVELETRTGKRRVREVIGRVRRPQGQWVSVRLWTSLREWQGHPARELLELYGRRWEQEVFYRELKIELKSHRLLRSHTPATAAQEVMALLLAQRILVDQRIKAARLGKVDVLSISFSKTLAMLQPLWLVLSCSEGILSDEQIQQMTRRVMNQIAEAAIPKRRKRSCPRAVRQPVSSWPRLHKNSYQTGPTEYAIKPITQ